jgi:hypothetical protein
MASNCIGDNPRLSCSCTFTSKADAIFQDAELKRLSLRYQSLGLSGLFQRGTVGAENGFAGIEGMENAG